MSVVNIDQLDKIKIAIHAGTLLTALSSFFYFGAEFQIVKQKVKQYDNYQVQLDSLNNRQVRIEAEIKIIRDIPH